MKKAKVGRVVLVIVVIAALILVITGSFAGSAW